MANYGMPDTMVLFNNDKLFQSPFPPTEAPEMLFYRTEQCQEIQIIGQDPYSPTLNPSPAKVKGHMKRPQHGIKSTRAKPNPPASEVPQPIPQINVPIIPIGHEMRAYPGPAYGRRQDPHWINVREESVQQPNLIGMDGNDQTIANVFCFGAFADKTSGIVYNDLTGSFPFVSLEGSVCFFVLYHYESNCILASPIKGMDDRTIFETYKK
jgi:hypothetical protein